MARNKANMLGDAARIRLLASPARQEVMDTLEALGGEATVAEIAQQLGKSADGLYYHLRLLVRGGLVEQGSHSTDARRFRTRSGKGGRTRLRYQPGATANAAAVERVAAGLLRIAGRDFAAAVARRDVIAEGRHRELWASRIKGWVSNVELAEINRLLERLGELMQGRRDGDRQRLLSLAWILAPVPEKAARRAGQTRG